MTVGNKATSNIQRVLVGDYGTMISIDLDNVEGDSITNVEWVRAYDRSQGLPTEYIDIPDFNVQNGVLHLTLPSIPKGKYKLEIKDEDGRFYPAQGELTLEMLASTYDAKEYVFITYYEQIMDEVEGMVEQYIIANPDGFKGDKGDKGKPFIYDDFTETQLNAMKDSVLADVLPELDHIINPPIDDPYNTPGPRHLFAGTREAGFFGFVSAHELGIDGTQLALEVGLSIGTPMEVNTPWMKFAWKGKIQFVPLKPLRHTVSWDDLYDAGLVYGTGSTVSDAEQYMLDTDAIYADKERVPQDARVTIVEHNFKVRLMRGSGSDPNEYSSSDRGGPGEENEWNRLILPLHINAPNNFSYNSFAGAPTEDWGTDLTDEDLRTHNTHGAGSYQWMQEYSDHIIEVDNGIQRRRVVRGYSGASILTARNSSFRSTTYAWRPVLELD